MWYYLDKRGYPIEWVKGRRFSNFVRFLLYCREITTDRPASMYPCWVCHNCAHVEAFDGPRERDCPKCKVKSEAGILFLVQRRYRPLTPGSTQGGSKNPPTRPRPDVKVPAQVAKPKKADDEGIQELRAQQEHMDKMLAAMREIFEMSQAVQQVDQLRAERDRLRSKMRQLCQGIEMGIPEPPDHVCGNPDSMCDGLCVDWSNWCQFIAECKKLSSPEKR